MQKEDEETEQEQEAPAPLVTHLNNNFHSVFSNVEVYNSNQQIKISNGLYAYKSYIFNNFKEAIYEHEGILHLEGYDFEEFFDEITEAPLSEPFLTRRMKMFSSPDGFMLYGKLGFNFFSFLNFCIQTRKLVYGGEEPDLVFTCLATTATLVLELFAHSTLVVLRSRMIVTRKERTFLHIPLWSSATRRL